MQQPRQLSAIAVANINRRGINFVGGVRGLGLNVTQSGTRSWILRYQIGGKRRDMGLGSYSDVGLGAARELARSARIKIAQGIDPIDDLRAKRSERGQAQKPQLTFRQAAGEYIERQESVWKSAKHAQQWRNTLDTYASSILADLPLEAITPAHVLAVLEPIWHAKTETATRLRSRIELILDAAIARGHREGPNPARWKGHLDKLLPAPNKIARAVHHRALPYASVPSFYKQLTLQQGMGALALRLVILTAARSGEVRGATWDEVDEASATWTVPASRMKAGREHRVPLSPAALELIRQQRQTSTSNFIFPSTRYDKPLSDMTLGAVLRRMEVDAVPHGFRTSFRNWAGEMTGYPSEVPELALAHTVANKVQAAYFRSDLLEKRRSLMAEWAQFVTT